MSDYFQRRARLQNEGRWRSTLGLDDVDLSTLDGAEPTENTENTISPEAQAVILQIKTMDNNALSNFNFENYPATTADGKAVRKAWNDKFNELNPN